MERKRWLRRAREIDKVIEIALAQRGKPYIYGSAGPSGFDCSGLVVYSFLHGTGVSLPHNAFQQFKATRRLLTRGLRPRRGDLVFYYSPIHHVGIYLGRGQIVQAGDPDLGIEKVHVDQYAQPVAWGRVRGVVSH